MCISVINQAAVRKENISMCFYMFLSVIQKMFFNFAKDNYSMMQILINNIGMTCQHKPPMMAAASRFHGGFLFISW